jgi:FkbM family methyltransferase
VLATSNRKLVFDFVRSCFRFAGIHIQRANTDTIDAIRLVKFLNDREVPLLLDVGANDGVYAMGLFSEGYSGKVVSIEPLPEARAILLNRAAGQEKRWLIGPQVALGSRNETRRFHVAKNSVSSSLLAMEDAHVDAAPNSAIVGSIDVSTRRLDDLWVDLAVDADRAFLKLDVQGGEMDVLNGAPRALSDFVIGIQIEMSIISLYSGQELWRQVDSYLTEAGFTLWDIVPGFRDYRSKRILQFDAIYFKD